MIRGYRVWDNQEKTYSDKAFSIDQLGICYIQDGDGYWEEIDEERYVVEQSTGLTDKNGREIYENDVVQIAGERASIVFDEKLASYMGRFLVEYRNQKVEYNDYIFAFCPDDIEVIGNIHEPSKDFRPEHSKHMVVSTSKGDKE